jgi:2-polyprenyl-3-methyl-5-hydroxy-6-metoxy-1,4-benzoquinol methylase
MDDQTKEITKLIWSLGNYEEIAKTSLPAAISMVDAVRLDRSSNVLDVATGSGNVALLAARKGATVTG